MKRGRKSIKEDKQHWMAIARIWVRTPELSRRGVILQYLNQCKTEERHIETLLRRLSGKWKEFGEICIIAAKAEMKQPRIIYRDQSSVVGQCSKSYVSELKKIASKQNLFESFLNPLERALKELEFGTIHSAYSAKNIFESSMSPVEQPLRTLELDAVHSAKSVMRLNELREQMYDLGQG